MLLPELIEYIFALCSSKDRSILCQVSTGWHTMAIKVSSQLSPLGELYYNQSVLKYPFDDNYLYKTGDYHLIVRLKWKYDDLDIICQSGSIDVTQLMISYGATNWNDGLYTACYGGHLELAKLMISCGANNWNGGLYGACYGGHLELAQSMISMGANDWNGGLSEACDKDRIDLIKLMIAKGADECYSCDRNIEDHMQL